MSATNRGAERAPADYYPTPTWCTRRILERLGPELPGGQWLEPGCGDGAIIRAVKAARPDVKITGVDLRTERSAALEYSADRVIYGQDLLTWEPVPYFDVAIGNPPYRAALDFVEYSMKAAKHVLFLLRLNWLAGAGRAEFLRYNRPDVYVLPNRPSFAGNGRTDATEYAWFHWCPIAEGRRGRLEVLPTTPAAERRGGAR